MVAVVNAVPFSPYGRRVVVVWWEARLGVGRGAQGMALLTWSFLIEVKLARVHTGNCRGSPYMARWEEGKGEGLKGGGRGKDRGVGGERDGRGRREVPNCLWS